MKYGPNEERCAIHCHSQLSPSFGCDITIYSNANAPMNCYSRLGYSYFHPQYALGTNEASTFLAGSHEFRLEEIEVYEK